MTFENFYNDLLDLAKKYEKQNIPLKIEQDLENNIVKIFGEKINSLARAKNGLNDITELAYATAEHHPYWNVSPSIKAFRIVWVVLNFKFRMNTQCNGMCSSRHRGFGSKWIR